MMNNAPKPTPPRGKNVQKRQHVLKPHLTDRPLKDHPKLQSLRNTLNEEEKGE